MLPLLPRRTLVCWICILTLLALAFLGAGAAQAQDWTEWRGPNRDGVSPEKNLPTRWTPGGAGQLWRAPYGGRSGPVVLGNRLYIQNIAGKGADEQERIVCLDANSGKLIWEYKFTVFHSDVPPHRVGWPSPAVDAETGNIYVLGVGGPLLALSPAGKLLWERRLTEEFGLITTHGGRTTSPMVEGDMVFISGPTFGWGAHGPASTKFFAFDKRTGEAVWVSAPGGRPTDTTYSPLMVADVNGTRLLITGASDGAVHAVKLSTGEPVWQYEYSKRGINTGVLMVGGNAFVSHSEENLDSNEMGMIVAVDAAATGKVGPQHIKWKHQSLQVGFSSPVTDGKLIYQVDNGAILYAFDAATGVKAWQHKLGTIQRASPVLADGKLYVGTENGKFYILKLRDGGVDVLDEDALGTAQDPEEIIASAAISRGRVFVVTTEATYAIGKPSAPARTVSQNASQEDSNPSGTPAWVQVLPTEFIARPGDRVQFRARLFDAKGTFIREEKQVTWSAGTLAGAIAADGAWSIPADAPAHAGEIKATVGGISGVARARVIPPLPWVLDLHSLPLNAPPPWWINATRKYAVKEIEGQRLLAKVAEIQHSFYTRARAFFGPVDLANYTTQADVRTPERRRQMGDMGVVAQGYTLVLFGSHQKMEIQSWQPETERIASAPFAWKPDTWYTVKLRVENLPDGKVRARGKAWPRGGAEPADWMVEKVDPIGVHSGSPGIFGSGPFEMHFDNVKVTPNQ
jgi:outer membrane protein assembly factor BamB